MKKGIVDLITYHRAYNYGAILQTYASIKFFEKLGYKVIVIDYVPNYLQSFGTIKNTFNQVDNRNKSLIKRIIYALIKTPSYKRLKRVFTYFINKNFNLTLYYSSIDNLINNKPIANLYCSGSDQIWNNYYSGEFDKAFFLDFTDDKDKCISLASSFGKNDFNKIEKEYLKKSLNKYSLLSVREKDGKEIINEIGFNNCMELFDPTLLINEDIWNKFAKGKMYKFKYILVYQLHGDSDAYDKAIQFAKIKGLKVLRIITMYHQIRINYNCKNIVIPTIQEFVNLFKNSEYVFTDSFHGTAFSIIFKKKLGVRLPKRFGNRITSLLNSIEASDIIIDNVKRWNQIVNDKYMERANYNMIKIRDKMIKEYKIRIDKIEEKGEN